MTDATTNKPVWATATRKLYRAAMYWGYGKRAAWTLASTVHKRMEDAWDYVQLGDLSPIDKPFVNDAALILAAREQVPALLELEECDEWLLRQADIQSHALQLLGLLDELYSYGLRRKRSRDGWKFYIEGGTQV